MKYSFFLNLFCFFLLIFVSLKVTAQETPQDTNKPPNIVFILADDHRWDLLGSKNSLIRTPNLDAIAEEGIVFENAFVTTPICASSRISILTGLTERTHDYTFSRPPTGEVESANMYPALLKQDGYTTGFVGKYEIKMSGADQDRFDYFKPLLQSKTNRWNDKDIPQTYYIQNLANEFIRDASNTNKPWVLAVNFWNPHAHDTDKADQFHYPPEFEEYYQDVDVPDAKNATKHDFEELPEFLKGSMARVRWEYRFADPKMYQRIIKRHYRAISSVDKAVGAISAQLEKLGVDDNTIIIYTGDNGYSLNERQLAGKWFGWEEDLRVPLIIKDPRQKTRRKITEMALNIDIAPTILDLAGVSKPSSYQGQSLVPLIGADPDDNWRTEFFFEHMYQPKRASIPPMFGVRTEHWKLVNFYKNDYLQLYDLTKDPLERNNLAYLPKYKYLTDALNKRALQYVNDYENARTSEVKSREHYLNSF